MTKTDTSEATQPHEYGLDPRLRGKLRFSVGMTGDESVEQVLEFAQLADKLGFFGCAMPDEVYHQDAWQLLAVAASLTSRVEFMHNTHVVLRDPAHVAQQLMTLDAISNGRASAMVSCGNLEMLRQCGFDLSGLKLIPGEIFGDDVVAAAMIDRLVHHAEIVALKGDSYRLRDRDLARPTKDD
jgi:hypothetical protein